MEEQKTTVSKPAMTTEAKMVLAVETWYAKHFHKHVTTGSPVLSADDKESLIEHVTAAAR